MKLEPPHSLPRVINSTAPVRVCDNGGWTDTWFAGHGKVFNIAVRPHTEVQVEVSRRTGAEPHIRVNAENLGDPAEYLRFMNERYGPDAVAELDGLRAGTRKVTDEELARVLERFKRMA